MVPHRLLWEAMERLLLMPPHKSVLPHPHMAVAEGCEAATEGEEKQENQEMRERKERKEKNMPEPTCPCPANPVELLVPPNKHMPRLLPDDQAGDLWVLNIHLHTPLTLSMRLTEGCHCCKNAIASTFFVFYELDEFYDSARIDVAIYTLHRATRREHL